MSPVSFSFGTPTTDQLVSISNQNPLPLWQQAIVKADLQILQDAFNVQFTEASSATASLTFADSFFSIARQNTNATAMDDRPNNAAQTHVFFNAERAENIDTSLFAKTAAKEIVHALTAGPNESGAHYTTPETLNPYPYPGSSAYTIEDLVAVGTKFGSTFHLSAGEQQVARLYLGEFGRMPDHAGLDVQLNAFHSGTSLVTLANAFLNTPEGLATFGTDRGATFVEHAYQAILGRQADPAGERVQVEALAHGLNPGQFIVNLVNSAEFLARIHDGLLFT